MNNVYRVIWNKSTQTFQAVCEFAKAQGKSSAKMVGSNNLPKSATKAFALTALAAGMMLSSSAWAQTLENQADKDKSLAISKDSNVGTKASVEGSGGIAIGDNALAKAEQKDGGKPAQNVAIGVNSETVYGGVAIGYKASTFKTPKNSPGSMFSHGDSGDHAQSVAIGYEATASGDQSVALGAQARAEGNSSIAIGGDDLDRVASDNPPEYNQTGGNNESSNNTEVARKYREITQDYLVDFSDPKKRYTTTKAEEAAVAIGVQSQAGKLATAFGTRTVASGVTSVALGVGASATQDGSFAAAAGAKSEGKSSIAIGTASKANAEGAVAVGKNAQSTGMSSIAMGTDANAKHKNSVALGSGSVTAEATPQTQGTVNGVTYGNFAGVGSAEKGSVSVGTKDAERQIKHVAAGEISATSTDAINGSQLYMVAKGTLEQMPVVYTNKNGDKVFKKSDGSFTDGKGVTVNKGDVIASMQNADGTTNNPMVLRNVAGNLPATYNTDAYNKHNKPVTKSQALPDPNNVNVNNAATVGDVLNVGWNLQGNGTAKDFVKAYDTVNFVNGTGTKATVTTTDSGKTSTIKYDVNVDGKTITTEEVDDPNNPGKKITQLVVNQDALPKDTDTITVVQSEDKSVTVTAKDKDSKGNTVYDVAVSKAKLTAGTDGKVINQNPADTTNGFVTGDDVANAINNSGFKLTTSKSEGGEVDGASEELVNPGDTVKIDAGKNIKVTQTGSTISIATTNDLAADSVNITNGPTINGNGIDMNGGQITDVKGNLKPTYNVGDMIVDNQTGKPTKQAQTVPTTSAPAPTPADAAKVYNNAATVGDVLNVGWNLQGNGTAKDFVKAYDTVNFVNGTGTTAKVTSNAKGTSSDVTFDVNTDGTTITTKEVADPNNPGKTITQVTANTTKLGDANKDGKVDTPVDADKGKLVTADDIANAINNAGFTLTVQGENGSLVKPGATVNMKNTDKNIVIDKSANSNDVVYNLAKDITVDSVKAGDTTLNNNGVTINNGPSFTKDKVDVAGNKITNVTAGTNDTDAVNVKQLKDSRTTVQSSDNSISVTQTEKDGRFDYDIKVNNQVIVENAQLPVVYTNKNGDKVYLITKPDGTKSFNTKADGKGDTVNNSDVIASMQNADGSTTEPTTLANVAGNLEPTYNVGDNVVGIDGVLKPKVTRLTATTEQAAPTNVAGIYNNAATVGDVLNAGWNLQGNGTAKDFVKAYDTVNFVNGTGTTAKVTINAKGTSSDVTFDVNTDGTTITTNSSGQITANTTGLTNGTDGKVKISSDADKGKLVNAGDIANAINNAGFTLTVQGKNGSLVKPGATVNMKNTDNNIVIDKSANSNDVVYNLAKDITVDSVKAGDTTLNNNGVTINNGPSFTKDKVDVAGNKITNVTAGTNDTDAVNVKQLKDSRTTVQSSDNSISVTQTEKGGHFDYDIKVNNQGVVNNAQLPVVYTDKNGNKVYKQPDGSFNTAVDGKGVTVNKGNVIASMQNADGSTTEPTTLTNVKSNLPSTYNNDVYNTGNKPVTTGQTLPEKINTSNAATAGDVLNSGWNLQGNGTAKDFVKAYDTVNFVNGTGTTAKVTTNKEGTSSDVTFDVNTDGTTITTKEVADPNNPGKTITQVTANTTKLGDANKDGKVDTPSDDNKGKLVTAGDIANAINNSGFNVQTNGGDKELVKTGETVNFVNGDNIEITNNGKDITIATAKDVAFDSVKVGDTVNITKDGINAGNTTITNVKAGTADTDAVNVSQLNEAVNNISTNITNNNKIIGGNDGSTNVKDINGDDMTTPDGTTKTVGEALTTYDAVGKGTVTTNSVVSAIYNINEQGTKYMHVNGGEASLGGRRDTNEEQSQANGGYATAIGYKTIADGDNSVAIGNQAKAGKVDDNGVRSGHNAVAIGNQTKALGEQSIAIGDNAQATGSQSISIGTGNVVKGNNSGAFGDPNYIGTGNGDGSGTYVIGNNNGAISPITANNTFIMGNNVSATADNNVILGNESSESSATTTAGTPNQVDSATVGGVTYGGFAGTASGITSVGAEGAERQIINVAPGEISARSTDAINGSQLYAVAEKVGNLNVRIDDVADDANAGVSSAMAMAALPQAYLPGKSMLTGGMASYNGEGAVAVGFSKLSDNGRWVLKMSGSADTQGNAGAAVGAGFHF